MPKCRNCKLYDLDGATDKAGRVLSNRTARCLWESTEVWPVSVSAEMNTRPRPTYMPPNSIHRCQRFIPRDK